MSSYLLDGIDRVAISRRHTTPVFYLSQPVQVNVNSKEEQGQWLYIRVEENVRVYWRGICIELMYDDNLQLMTRDLENYIYSTY